MRRLRVGNARHERPAILFSKATGVTCGRNEDAMIPHNGQTMDLEVELSGVYLKDQVIRLGIEGLAEQRQLGGQA